jgi:hypothetical protein
MKLIIDRIYMGDEAVLVDSQIINAETGEVSWIYEDKTYSGNFAVTFNENGIIQSFTFKGLRTYVTDDKGSTKSEQLSATQFIEVDPENPLTVYYDTPQGLQAGLWFTLLGTTFSMIALVWDKYHEWKDSKEGSKTEKKVKEVDTLVRNMWNNLGEDSKAKFDKLMETHQQHISNAVYELLENSDAKHEMIRTMMERLGQDAEKAVNQTGGEIKDVYQLINERANTIIKRLSDEKAREMMLRELAKTGQMKAVPKSSIERFSEKTSALINDDSKKTIDMEVLEPLLASKAMANFEVEKNRKSLETAEKALNNIEQESKDAREEVQRLEKDRRTNEQLLAEVKQHPDGDKSKENTIKELRKDIDQLTDSLVEKSKEVDRIELERSSAETDHDKREKDLEQSEKSAEKANTAFEEYKRKVNK